MGHDSPEKNCNNDGIKELGERSAGRDTCKLERRGGNGNDKVG